MLNDFGVYKLVAIFVSNNILCMLVIGPHYSNLTKVSSLSLKRCVACIISSNDNGKARHVNLYALLLPLHITSNFSSLGTKMLNVCLRLKNSNTFGVCQNGVSSTFN